MELVFRVRPVPPLAEQLMADHGIGPEPGFKGQRRVGPPTAETQAGGISDLQVVVDPVQIEVMRRADDGALRDRHHHRGVPTLLAASRASAVIVCGPSATVVVSHDTV